jgi:hypothetical protein
MSENYSGDWKKYQQVPFSRSDLSNQPPGDVVEYDSRGRPVEKNQKNR